MNKGEARNGDSTLLGDCGAATSDGDAFGEDVAGITVNADAPEMKRAAATLVIAHFMVAMLFFVFLLPYLLFVVFVKSYLHSTTNTTISLSRASR